MKTNERTVAATAAPKGWKGNGADRAKTIILGGLTALALFGSVGFVGGASHAEARVNGPRFDSLSIFCGGLQDRRDAIWAEFNGASKARQEELMDELRGIMQNWTSLCQGTFGAIGVRLAPEVFGNHVTGIDQVAPAETTSPVRPSLPVSPIRASHLLN